MTEDDKTPDDDYEVPDRSTPSPDDLEDEMPDGAVICYQCDGLTEVSAGATRIECVCGHRWTLSCVPAHMMEELERER